MLLYLCCLFHFHLFLCEDVHLLYHQLWEAPTMAKNKNSFSVNAYSNRMIIFVDSFQSSEVFYFPYFLSVSCIFHISFSINCRANQLSEFSFLWRQIEYGFTLLAIKKISEDVLCGKVYLDHTLWHTLSTKWVFFLSGAHGTALKSRQYGLLNQNILAYGE